MVIHKIRCGKPCEMDLCTKLYTLSTRNGDKKLVYIGFFQNGCFGQEYQNVDFCNKFFKN